MINEPLSDLEDDDSVFIVPDEEKRSDPKSLPVVPAQHHPKRINVVRSVRRHRLIAVLMFVLVWVVGAPLIYLRAIRPVYYAESQLLVSPIFPKNLIEDREYQVPRYEEFVNQQLAMIVRQEVMIDVLERLGPKRALWDRPGEGKREAATRLSNSIISKRVPNTTLISVGMEGSTPDLLADLVNTVTETYLARIKTETTYDTTNTVEALKKHKEDLLEQIKTKTEQMGQWAKELGVANVDLKAPEPPTPGERQVVDARTRLLDAETKLATTRAQYEIAKKLDVELEARDQLAADPELNGLKTVLLTRKNELKAKLMGLTREHEGRQSVERLLADIDAEIDRAQKSSLEKIRSTLVQRREARFNQDLQIAQAELELAQRLDKAQEEEKQAKAVKLARLNSLYYDVQTVRQDLERLNRQLGSVEDRIDLMRLDTRAPSYLRVVIPAQYPERPIKRPISGSVIAVSLAAFAMAFGIPLFLDITNQKVRSPIDLEALLHNRPLGWILDRTPATEPFVRDQIRRIALSLDRERRLYDRTHFVFTSLRPGGGTTRLVLDLARELQEISVRAIVVEANALHPDARLAAADGHPGMAAVLEGVARIEEAILPGANGRPDLISVGDNQGRKQLSGCRNVRPILDKLVSRYEVVLIDAPPILLSSDAELLASGSHATILVVEAEKTNIGEVNRAIQIMRQVGPPLIQVVVNRVRDYRGLGYYSDLVKEYDSRESSRSG